MFCWLAVSVMRRSCGSRGRIEMRFSCCDEPVDGVEEEVAVALESQPAVGGEVGVPEDHHAGLGLGGVLGFGASGRGRRVGRRRRHRGRERTGPALSPFSISRLTSPVVLSALMSVSPQLFGLVSTSVCGNLPLVPPVMGATDLASL